MFMSRTDCIPESSSSNDALLSCQASGADGDEETDSSTHIVYMASFDELAEKYLQYDTIIWISISLLLVLAWGVGVIMLLYLPYKRYVLQKDISSRKLYITPAEIVYKVHRPSYIPFWRVVTVERRVSLSLVIDIIVEQGCLESVFQLHTFRVESIPCGGAAAVDELQVQGVSSPRILRKAIISEASKVIQSSMAHISFLAERPFNSRTPCKSWKGHILWPRPQGEGKSVEKKARYVDIHNRRTTSTAKFCGSFFIEIHQFVTMLQMLHILWLLNVWA